MNHMSTTITVAILGLATLVSLSVSPTAQALSDSHDVLLAQFEDDLITRSDIAKLSALRQGYRAVASDSSLEQKATQQWIERAILLSEARKAGVVVDDLIKQRASMFVTLRGGAEALRKRFESQGITPEAIYQLAEEDLLIEKFISSRLPKNSLSVTSKELREEYDTYRNEYRIPERRRVQHLVLTVPPDASPELERKVRLEARRLYRKLKSKSSDFLQYAIAHPSPVPNAKPEFVVEQGMLPPRINPVVFALPKGVISRPLETQQGIHIYKVMEISPAEDVPYEEVKEQAARAVRERRQAKMVKEYLNRVRSNYRITFFGGENEIAHETIQPAPSD